MENFTWGQIILAVGGSGGILVTLLAIAKFISERFDLRVGRKTEQGRLTLEERRDSNAEIWKIVDAKNAEIKELEEEIEALKNDNKLTRPVVRDIYRKLAHLESRAKALRVAHCPAEVVDVINDRINEFLHEIGEARDLLP